MLYKYPQREFPYAKLVAENKARGQDQPEFDLIDSDVFDDDRYFDVFVEYAKAAPDDTLMLVTVHNRGPDAATIRLLPQLTLRDTWSWAPNAHKPSMKAERGAHRRSSTRRSATSGWTPTASRNCSSCENESNAPRLWGHTGVAGPFKDAFHEYVVNGKLDAVNPAQRGTKAGALYRMEILRRRVGAGARAACGRRPASNRTRSPISTQTMATRRREADAFYDELQHGLEDPDVRLVQRQAFAGMLWTKQFYCYDVTRWLQGDPTQPPPPAARKQGRNKDWGHVAAAEVISMPDKWEYPWFAAWDLAFHCYVFADIDPEFAKHQLILLAREWYMHPNGQLPAYEWAFGDVNPPVHAWAAHRVFQIDQLQRRRENPDDPGDLEFLERVFQKLLLNFTWWVNRKDEQGRNIFQGGFLGLDNIGVFDRSQALPTGGYINQADGTSWMAAYCLNMLRIAAELGVHNHAYEDIASKFFEHFLSIAAAINGEGDTAMGLWDEADQFYYDHISLPDGRNIPLKLESLVGLTPLFVCQPVDPVVLAKLPHFTRRMEWYLANRPEMATMVSNWKEPGVGDWRLLSLLRAHRMTALLSKMLDERHFLSDFGVRSMSKVHERAPYELNIDGARYEVIYAPAESTSTLFGGNSNWRGPVWLNMNLLLIEALEKFDYYYGPDFKVECPTGSGNMVTLREAAHEIGRRITRIFLKGEDGERPVLKSHPKLSGDPHFRDYVHFHEYFHGDTGRGLGASHQTGWTGVVARLLWHETGRHAFARSGSRRGEHRPPLARAVRAHDRIPLHLPADHDRAGAHPRGHAGDAPAYGQRALHRHGALLDEDLRAHLRHRGGHRHPDGIPVRHELGELRALRRRHLRQPARDRRRVRVLPRVGVPRDPAFRVE